MAKLSWYLMVGSDGSYWVSCKCKHNEVKEILNL